MAAKQKDLSAQEISERTAVLKRFRELLKAQRDRFQAYLVLLEKQKDSIEKGAAEDLLHHVELEEKIVADIFSIQKVIDPLENMYRDIGAVVSAPNAGSRQTGSRETEEVTNIKSALEDLKKEAIVRSKRNKDLLSKRMNELRSEIKTLRASPYNRQRSAHSAGPAPSIVDIRG